jgi:L-ascorbate metabolism protein UlaG (beta-lactamase superfamily)
MNRRDAKGGMTSGRSDVRPSRWRWVRQGLLGLAALALSLVAFVLVDGWRAFGRRATGARRARMEASPEWRDGHFANPQPLRNSASQTLSGALHISPYVSPAAPLPVDTGLRRALDTPPRTGLRVTWLGHSTVLLEIDGRRVLVDPVWSGRASPLGWVGPRRWFAPPIALADLPAIDVVLITHDHYDHLDRATIAAMKSWPTTFVVPLGIGAHLSSWGVPEARIVELDWWGRTRIAVTGGLDPRPDGLEIVCTPARHASGRMLIDDDAKLWAGYAIIGTRHRVYDSGDTGLFPALREIGARLGPFDLTMIEVGQYNRAWPDWHLGPEQAVRAHQMVRGRVMLPVHWGAFALAYHAWTEPIERALAAADAASVAVLAPQPGQAIEPAAPPPRARWWPDLPWNTGDRDPIASTQMN